MRTTSVFAALAMLSLLLPAAAEARGGGSDPGLFGRRGGGGGGPSRAAPLTRGSSGGFARTPSTGSSRGSSLFGRSGGRSGSGSLFGGSSRTPSRSSPRVSPQEPTRRAPSFTGSGRFSTSRDRTPSRSAPAFTGDHSRRQGVPSVGQRPSAESPSFRSSPRAPSGTSPARAGTYRGRPDGEDGAFGRSGRASGESPRAPARPSDVNGGFRGRDGTFGTAPAERPSGAGVQAGASTRGAAPGFRGQGGGQAFGGPRAAGGGPAGAPVRPPPATPARHGYRVGGGAGWADGAAAHVRHGFDRHSWGGTSHGGYHDWYDHDRWYLSFSFGLGCGPYAGVGYYWPYRSWTLGIDYAFFYPAPVTYCYAPFGFYSSYTPYYVTRYETVRETVPVYVYETRVVYTEEEIEAKAAAGEAGPAAPPAEDGEVKVADPKPAAGSPATEKLLREASELFHGKKYYDAAVKFRLAAISSPDLPGPLFALGQSLIALGQDEYAAKVLRRAVIAHPVLVKETADIAGVYADQAEFDRVMAELEARAADSPSDGDARFLLGYQRYFSGDPRCRADFDGLQAAAPADGAVKILLEAVESRFKAAADLPEIK